MVVVIGVVQICAPKRYAGSKRTMMHTFTHFYICLKGCVCLLYMIRKYKQIGLCKHLRAFV